MGINQLRRVAEAADISMLDLMRSAYRHPDLARWHSSCEGFTQRVEQLAHRSANLKLIEVIDVIAKSVGTHRLRSVERLKKFVGGLPSDLSVADFIDKVHKNRGLDLAGGAPEPEEEIDAVSIMSMHSAKGLTYDVVFILGMERGSFPDPRQDEAEQRRLMYVAMTRARNQLFLCYAKRRKGPPAKGFSFYKPSRFLADIPSQHRDLVKNAWAIT